jgi:hypothetical protein
VRGTRAQAGKPGEKSEEIPGARSRAADLHSGHERSAPPRSKDREFHGRVAGVDGEEGPDGGMRGAAVHFTR